MIETYCCALCFDTFSCRAWPDRVAFPSLLQSLELVKHILEGAEISTQKTMSARKYYEYVIFACTGRCIVTTQEGHIGIAHDSSRPGDCVCIIPGCRDLLVLRPKGSEYQVVGTAYIHGMNHGEPIFGQFPTQYEPVLRNEGGVL